MDARLRLKVLDRAMREPADWKDAPKIASEAIGAAERTIETRASLERRRRAALAAYKQEVQAVDGLLESLQKQCGHPSTTIVSGGLPGDGYTECDLCGSQF